jgi:hypothetical protein
MAPNSVVFAVSSTSTTAPDMLNYAKSLAARWRKNPFGLRTVLCPRCTRVVTPDVLSPGERVFWCAHCSAVREVPAFRIPGWIAGVMVVLLLRLPLIS